jgi:hypothetical protein
MWTGLADEVSNDEQLVAPTFVSNRATLTVTFTAASFLGSFLLFLIQPMAARFLLPVVGGSTALWSTALVFFQGVLLLGYLFAHGSTNMLGTRRQPLVQMVLLLVPLAFLPVALPDGWQLPLGASPTIWVLTTLSIIVGVPFFVLATSSPTLQRWLSWTDHPDADDPYFLYSAGNVGSVLALLGYPLLLEPVLDLKQQATLWAALYVLYVLTVSACVVFTRSNRPNAEEPLSATVTPPVTARQRGRWVLLSAVPAALLLGVTQFLSVDIAPFPMLWVLPLLLYLMTFVVVFRRSGTPQSAWPRRITIGLAPLVASSTLLGTALVLPLWVVVSSSLIWFFFAVLVVHVKLSEDRPAPVHLTEYFALLSLGGALGGTFVSLVVPVIFDFNLEFALAMTAVLLIAAGPERSMITSVPRWLGITLAGLTMAACIAIGGGPALLLFWASLVLALLLVGKLGVVPKPEHVLITLSVGLALTPTIVVSDTVLLRDRSFFGTYRVTSSEAGHVLVSGTTLHGTQRTDTPGNPTTYYASSGPLGDLFDVLDRPVSVGIVGLGAGAIAAYGEAADDFTFYEIDPLVIRIAQNRDYFSYLDDSRAKINIEVGDGRTLLDRSSNRHDVLIVDAFTSDAIPVHLLTVEALALYQTRLAPGGVLLIHISNRHFDLAKVIARAADELDLDTRRWLYEPDDEAKNAGATTAEWILISEPSSLIVDDLSREWRPVADRGPLWTDDFSNLLSVIDW